MPEDLYGPMRPAAGWAVLGVVLVAVVIAWFAWVWWSTRPRRRRRQRGAAGPGWTVAERRARALAEIDQIEAAHAAGELSPRAVFQRLSPLVRWFVYESSGTPAHVHALAELRHDDDVALAATVEWMYPEEFAADAPGAVAEGLARARWYVRNAGAADRPASGDAPSAGEPALPGRVVDSERPSASEGAATGRPAWPGNATSGDEPRRGQRATER